MIKLLDIVLLCVLAVKLTARYCKDYISVELKRIATKYQLIESQKSQVRKLITERDQNFNSLSTNTTLTEPQRNLNRSTIVKGFEGSFQFIQGKVLSLKY